MECPICKNKMGFCCGTCIECGFNYLDGTFHKIEVNTNVLEALVPKEILWRLIDEHESMKRR